MSVESVDLVPECEDEEEKEKEKCVQKKYKRHSIVHGLTSKQDK